MPGPLVCRHFLRPFWMGLAVGAASLSPLTRGADAGRETFQRDIQPVLEKYCYDCHGNGVDKGGVTLDEVSPEALHDRSLWLRVLKNTRAGLMPPASEEHE